MGVADKYSDAVYAAKLDKARNEGKDYAVFSYDEFKARFAHCTHCDWLEALSWEWQDNPQECMNLMKHTARHRKAASGSE